MWGPGAVLLRSGNNCEALVTEDHGAGRSQRLWAVQSVNMALRAGLLCSVSSQPRPSEDLGSSRKVSAPSKFPGALEVRLAPASPA